MPRGKRNKLDLLSLLTADRRLAIVEEALGSHIHGIFARHSKATLGKLIEGLVGDQHWKLIQNVRVATVLRPSGGGSAGGTPRATGARRGRPPGKKNRLSDAAIAQIVETIRKKPGLRSEQIQRELELGQGVVKSGLARLRQEGRVRTSGQRRSTVYALA